LSKSSFPMMHSLPITQARINLGAIAKRAHLSGEYFILEKDGIPVAGIMGADEMEDYIELRDPKVLSLLSISPAPISAQGTVFNKSPKEVLQAYRKMDADGMRLTASLYHGSVVRFRRPRHRARVDWRVWRNGVSDSLASAGLGRAPSTGRATNRCNLARPSPGIHHHSTWPVYWSTRRHRAQQSTVQHALRSLRARPAHFRGGLYWSGQRSSTCWLDPSQVRCPVRPAAIASARLNSTTGRSFLSPQSPGDRRVFPAVVHGDPQHQHRA
jgi:hypothetical protein